MVEASLLLSGMQYLPCATRADCEQGAACTVRSGNCNAQKGPGRKQSDNGWDMRNYTCYVWSCTNQRQSSTFFDKGRNPCKAKWCAQSCTCKLWPETAMVDPMPAKMLEAEVAPDNAQSAFQARSRWGNNFSQITIKGSVLYQRLFFIEPQYWLYWYLGLRNIYRRNNIH